MYNIDVNETYIDGYIDDFLTLIIDDKNLIPRGIHAIPLFLYLVFRPVHKNEPVERNDILSKAKLLAEGKLEEEKTFLGWKINTYSLRITLPSLKALKWLNEIDDLLNKKCVNQKDLESIIGKLNHAAFIIPLSRYFLNRLRFKLKSISKSYPKPLARSEKDDLLFFKDILSIMSSKGTSILNVTYSQPNIFCWSDACGSGLGGYNHRGVAWRFQIPTKLKNKASINLLEFLASIVTIILSLENVPKYQKILAFTDSSSALGWLYKSSFHPATHHQHDIAARYLALFMIRNEHSLYATHIAGSKNNIADALSRDFNLNNIQLTNAIHSHYIEQVPKNFKIVPLPKHLSSWIVSILESQTVEQASHKAHQKNTQEISENGKCFAKKLESKTHFSNLSTKVNESTYYARSQQKSEEIILDELRKKFCKDALWKTHSDLFVRTSGLTIESIQELTKTD